ncbi:5'-nucleotidase [Blastococcus colisei]|uniref:5'-nucleotidase n=1 Tax=Blastococcus colisei TaxID=1564162 RepID=A0A543PGL2_9ACTN|nr:ExeM/NucH family extracellular endonuclease [Blastococcus colisei]TQN43229.1 5'-nucleotidase [Blastococcus colisei]
MPEQPGTTSPRATARVVARRAVLGTAAASIAVVGMPVVALAAPPATPFISEIHYDDDGTDTGEFIEVQLPAGTSSAGLSIELYNQEGSNYDTDALPELTAPAGRAAVVVVDYPTDGIQNGPTDGMALVHEDGTVLEFLSYEGLVTAAAGQGMAAGTTTTDIGVSERSVPEGQSLSRVHDAAADELVWSGPAAATRGVVNGAEGGEPGGEGPAVCDVTPTHEIGEVQGASGVTPLDGQQVTVQGVVVGDLPDMSGFYLQDVDGDGNPATSDGIFVFSPLEVDLGDTVTAAGTAEEYFDQTQVSAGDAAEVCAEGATADLPAAAALDLPADDAARERFEGMLVAPADGLTVSEVYDLTRFGELTLSEGGILVQPTELARPGPDAEAVAEQNALRRIVLDDGLTARVSPATAPYLSPENPVRVGDELDFTSPLVLGYGFDSWRLQPADGTADGTFAPQDTRPAAPDEVGGDIQVGAFNVLNYFLTFGDSDTARGALTPEAFELQAAKIVTAINEMDADVLALMEIEDTASTAFGDSSPDQAVADLVRRLNEAAGTEKWAFTAFPDELLAVDRDVIRNAIIYQPAAVTPVGDSVGLVDEANFDNAREPIAQTFEAQGDQFTVIANHFKSKGSGDGANADQGDGQGASNPDRIGQAEALAGFVEDLRASTGDDDVMVLGDLNAYSQEDPIQVLRDAGLIDLGTQFDEGRYSYVFDDESGSLDHAMATDGLTAKVTDVAHWNINSVESFAYQYNGAPGLYASDPFRSSDHDPILVGLDLSGTGTGGGTDGGDDDGITELQLLGINDFHGRLSAGDTTRPPAEGAVALAGTVEEQRARDDVDATLLLSAGDNIGASPFVSSVQQDVPTLEVLNEMGLQASAVGNHEFDRGFADLIDRVGVDGESGLADFPYLGANVYGADGTAALPEYALLDAAGVTVAVIGVVTQETSSLVSPAGIEGITFGDPVEATDRVVAELTDGAGDEADVIVLLAHEGAPASDSLEEQLAADTAFAAIVNGVDAEVDAIFTGHTHQSYAWEAPVPGGEGVRPVIQTGSYAMALGRIALTYEEATDEVTAFTVENLPLTERTEEELVAAYPRVAEVAATVAAAQAFAEAVGSEVIGSVTADITRAFTADGTEDRGSYSALGGLVADSYVYGSELSAIEPADLGLVNPGGLRADLLHGDDGQITLAEANAVTPFANDLVVTSLTGAQLVQVLEQQWQPEGSSRPFLALGTSEELTWSYDPAAPAGERIIVDSIRISGEPIDLGATYRVATNSFLAAGGDNFTAFAEGTTEGTGLIDFDSFQAYLEENPALDPANYVDRVTVGEAEEPAPVTGVTVSPTTFAARDRVTVSVTGFGPSERVVVTLDGDRLGRVRTDADGAGSLRVRIPRGVEAGSAEIVATGSDSDRTATVQVEITAPEQPGSGWSGNGGAVGQLLSWFQEVFGKLLRGWFGN